MLIERRVDYTRSRNLILTSLVLVAGVSGASVTIGTVALKGMALGTVVAIVASLILAVFDRFGLANDAERPALPERI
jgi:uracil permease